MSSRHPHPGRRGAAAAALALGFGSPLAGCGGGDGGETLGLGDSAEVDYYPTDGSTDATGSGTVTVTDVREGSSTELEDGGFSLEPGEQEAAVYYVDVAYENQGDRAVQPGSTSGEDPEGNLISDLTVIDLGGEPFATCPGMPEEVPAGGSAEGCTILLVPEGHELDRISYFPGGSADFVYWETGL